MHLFPSESAAGCLPAALVFSSERYDYTILILNDYKDAERRSAEGDRKALCSPPQRRNLLAANKDMI